VTDPRELATAELLGALTYAQLRSFQVAANVVRFAPNARTADQLADFSLREHHGYVLLRERLAELTDIPSSVLDRQRGQADRFFDNLPITDWVSATAFLAVGLPIAADFARAVAPALDEPTAQAVLSALAERDVFERFALSQLDEAVGDDEDERERARHLVADILGRAIRQFQGAIEETDALRVLFGGEAAGDAERRTAMGVLDQHRRRMAEIGLDSPE